MTASILSLPPISGRFEELHFGDSFNNNLWVKFSDIQYNEWVGCFQKAHEAFEKVLISEASGTAFIVAGGKGYLIDIANKKLLFETDEIPLIQSIVFAEETNLFICGRVDRIDVFSGTCFLKSITPDFFVDGIFFQEVIGAKAIGDMYSYYYQDLNVGFEFDVKTYEIKVDTKVKVKRFGPFEFVRIEKK